MEDYEQKYIDEKEPDLHNLITWNTEFTVHLTRTSAIRRGEKDELNLINPESQRTEKLLRILRTRTNGYSNLQDALEKSGQTGAVAILKAIVIPGASSQTSNPANIPVQSGSQQQAIRTNPGGCILDLPYKSDLANNVLLKVRADLISKLGNENTNTNIILQLGTLLVFDHDEINEIVKGDGDYRSQKKRMTELFHIIAELSDDKIALCLTKLCNLDELPRMSERVQDVFKKHFPGSCK